MPLTYDGHGINRDGERIFTAQRRSTYEGGDYVLHDGSRDHYGFLFCAAEALQEQAQVLHCLATSPRFQAMTVADALAELSTNGCGYDNGAALEAAQVKYPFDRRSS